MVTLACPVILLLGAMSITALIAQTQSIVTVFNNDRGSHPVNKHAKKKPVDGPTGYKQTMNSDNNVLFTLKPSTWQVISSSMAPSRVILEFPF